MAQAKISSKGQLTLPVEIRNYLNVDSGDCVEFVIDHKGRVNVIAKTVDIKDIFGMIKAKQHVSVDDMKKAVKQRAAIKKGT